MLKSNYNYGAPVDPKSALKKKILKPEIDAELLSPEELESKISLKNRSADDTDAKKTVSIVGGNYDEVKKSSPIAANVLNSKTEEEKSSRNWGEGTTGSKISSAATDSIGMVGTVLSKNGPMNRKERTANSLNLTAQGAKAGSAFGPLGTAIGAGAGLLTGLAMGIGDQKELDEEADKEKLSMLDKTKTNRMNAQKLEEGKMVAEKKKAILKSQMGMLGSNYGETKTT